MFWNFQPSLCRVMGLLCPKAAKGLAERFIVNQQSNCLSIIHKAIKKILRSLTNLLSMNKEDVKCCPLALYTSMATSAIKKVRRNDVFSPRQTVASLCGGFTLLEMLMVIALLAVVMVTSTSLITDEGAGERLLQVQQDGTQARWNQIRAAVIGDTNLTLSNPSMISGYVADMGRLPVSIDELLTRGAQPAWTRHDINTVNPDVLVNTAYLWGGWRGPYLYTAGSQFFRDAWSNESEVDDASNHGWVVTHQPVSSPACTTVPDCTDISVQSLGNDGVIGGIDFNTDYPATPLNLVNTNEWQISAASIGFNVVLNKAPNASQDDLLLEIYFIDDGELESVESSGFTHLITEVGSSSHVVTISPAGASLPMGKYAAVVSCSATKRVYDGDCDPAPAPAPAKAPYYFTLLPTTTLPITISWNIP